jgi:hypothetical protein
MNKSRSSSRSSKDGTWPASSYGYRLTALNHGRPTLTYVSQSDPSMKVRAAGAQLLKRTNGEQP